MTSRIAPLKDEEVETEVPHVWRHTISAIVDSLIAGDAELGQGLEAVVPLSAEDTALCREQVAKYGSATLVPLPDEAWTGSAALWQGDRWDCLVDLWSAEEGRLDLILDLRVTEDGSNSYRFSPYFVYVP